VQRVIVGGDYRMLADVTLVDAKSGAVITAYPEMLHAVAALNGWAGVIVQAAYDASNSPGDRVVNGFAEKYKAWLLKS
jgi:nitrogen fixation protein FixH